MIIPQRSTRYLVVLLSVWASTGCFNSDKTTEPASPPASSPQVKTKAATYARGSVVDSHTLIAPVPASIEQAIRIFDKAGVGKFCNKNGGWLGSKRFAATVTVKHNLGDRFAFFANLNWEGVDEPGWGQREADRLAQEVHYGAKGVKIFKALGLGVRDSEGKLLAVDDPRLDPIFRRAAELNAVVAMHTGDPKAFFEPVTPDNERYYELNLAPSWSFYGKDYPTRKQLLDQRENLFRRHPKTTFLLIHLANNPEDLDYVDRLLATYPNVYVDTSARVPEIGRHDPERVRRLFERYSDRILFGTDLALSPRHMQLGSVSETPPTEADAVEFYQRHYRYFETRDRQIDHPTPSQGKWKVDGAGLPPEVLNKFYRDNALRLIFDRQMNVEVVDPLAESSAAPR